MGGVEGILGDVLNESVGFDGRKGFCTVICGRGKVQGTCVLQGGGPCEWAKRRLVKVTGPIYSGGEPSGGPTGEYQVLVKRHVGHS